MQTGSLPFQTASLVHCRV